MAVTISDIARIAGVHKATVSRALRDDKRVNSATVQRIKTLAAELKYRPNSIAATLSVGRSKIIAAVAVATHSREFHVFLDPIRRHLQRAGYSLMFYAADESPDGERMCVDQLLTDRVAGAIIHPSPHSTSPEPYRELIQAGIKLVTISGYIEGLDAPQIVDDGYQAYRLATEHLISLGHKRIVYLAMPEISYEGRERARGFRDALTQAGIPVTQSSVVETQYSTDHGKEVTSRLLKRKNPPTALVTRNDIVAMGAMRAISEAGLSIPQDISIVGFGDVWFSDLLGIPLTTIHYPSEQIADIAVTKILHMLAGWEVRTGRETVSVNLVVRSSCAPP